MLQKPASSGFVRPSWIFLTFLLFIIYNSNFRWIHTADSIPNRLLPFSLLERGNFYLDDWVKPYLPPGGRGAYYVWRSRGHWLSRYPVVMPLAIAPLYVLPAWWLARQHPSVRADSYVGYTVINTMEKLSASLVAALSVGVLYLALQKVTSPGASLWIALVYGVASTTWAISSQALWRHGFTELAFACFLLALFNSPTARGQPFWAGLSLGLAAANKPAHAVFAALFLVYFSRTHRARVSLYCAPLVAVGLGALGYNLYFFGRLLGAYPEPLALSGTASSVAASAMRVPWWHGLFGLLINPNRGLLIYVPWTVLALWGAARLWKEKAFAWGKYIVAGVATVFVMHAGLGEWWAGTCYGPRYLTDLLPFLALFLVPLWPHIQADSLVRAAFGMAVAVALWVQVVGAFYYPYGNWDGLPVDVDMAPSRLWDWTDTQIMRSWRAGPAEPRLLYDWWVMYKMREDLGDSQPSA